MFDCSVRNYADRPCVDFLGKKYTYAEIDALVARAAHGFQQLGLGKGSRIGLCLPNTPYYVICYFAALKIGATLVNFNPLYAERELEYQINDSGTEIMVTLDLKQIFPKVNSCLKTTCLKRIVVCAMDEILPPVKSVLFNVLKRSELIDFPRDPQHLSFTRLTNTSGEFKAESIDPEQDLAVLQYTGGTTGVPKGAMLTHRNLAANTNQLCNWKPSTDFGNERVLAILPFFHVFAMTVVMNVGLAIGAELILLPRFELEQCLKVIAKKKPTFFPGVPTIYTAINGAENLKKFDLSSLKFCLSGGAPLPVEVKKEFEENTGCKLVEGYGLSESSPVLTANPFLAAPHPGSIGVQLGETDVQIRNPDNLTEEVAQGEKGEVCAKGPQVMQGYWNNVEATADVFTPDGYLRTGDVGYRDPEGYIYLVDRMKDIILCGGYNVYPRNIEEAIYLHPNVAEVTVIGIPDDYRGQAPKAFIKLADGKSLNKEELKDFLKDKISRIEMPSDIEFRDELPKTLIGKLSKKELVEEEAGKNQQTA
nr:long-chain fatty acid--CoA ligase [Aestuariispira insulae]